MTRTRTNVPASVRARLLNWAHGRDEEFQLVLQRYAAERFLYRLGESGYRDRLVLKGAMLFALWGGSMYRATRDLDLTAYLPDDEHELVRVIERICREPCPSDGIVFLLDTIRAESIRDESEYHGFRVHVDALLAGARVTLQVDAGFGNAIEPPAVETDYPTLLDAPAPRIRAYPREAVVAEKLHALVHRGAVNSRMKDFYDLFVLAARFDFKGPDLSRAISATFARRRTPVPATLPTGLSTPFFADPKRAAMWRSYLSRNGLPGAPAGFDAVGQSVRAFLWPPLMALAHGPAFSQNWTAGGPWR